MVERFAINDLPVFLVLTILHLSDIIFTVLGRFNEILWIVLLISSDQTGFLLYAKVDNRRPLLNQETAPFATKKAPIQ